MGVSEKAGKMRNLDSLRELLAGAIDDVPEGDTRSALCFISGYLRALEHEIRVTNMAIPKVFVPLNEKDKQ